MHFNFLLSFMILFTAALARLQKPANHFGCLSEPSQDFLQAASKMAKQNKTKHLSPKDFINVKLYFHVLASSDSEADGNISDETLDKQLAVINDNYTPHGISFTLAGTDRTLNPDWADYSNETEIKYALRRGSYRDLNVYFFKKIADTGLAGQCHFPAPAPEGGEVFNTDGCIILASVLPGSSERYYNQGKTLTHEIGHWFGLLHPFHGGCSGEGDHIADTPAQASQSFGCEEGRDSCPDSEGEDPVHNFMGYSQDSCRREFTDGQEERMHMMFEEFRGGVV